MSTFSFHLIWLRNQFKKSFTLSEAKFSVSCRVALVRIQNNFNGFLWLTSAKTQFYPTLLNAVGREHFIGNCYKLFEVKSTCIPCDPIWWLPDLADGNTEILLNLITFTGMYSGKEGTKRMAEKVDHSTEKDNKDQFRRRQPGTKPANP